MPSVQTVSRSVFRSNPSHLFFARVALCRFGVGLHPKTAVRITHAENLRAERLNVGHDHRIVLACQEPCSIPTFSNHKVSNLRGSNSVGWQILDESKIGEGRVGSQIVFRALPGHARPAKDSPVCAVLQREKEVSNPSCNAVVTVVTRSPGKQIDRLKQIGIVPCRQNAACIGARRSVAMEKTATGSRANPDKSIQNTLRRKTISSGKKRHRGKRIVVSVGIIRSVFDKRIQKAGSVPFGSLETQSRLAGSCRLADPCGIAIKPTKTTAAGPKASFTEQRRLVFIDTPLFLSSVSRGKNYSQTNQGYENCIAIRLPRFRYSFRERRATRANTFQVKRVSRIPLH